MTPLLSIVIANYNYGRFLDEAIQSVVSQNMGDKVELIICDGGSTDNSVDIIKKYANGLPPNTSRSEWPPISPPSSPIPQPPPPLPHPPSLISWWCSEKDKGQSDAFNKGFAHACGKYLTWLNADDIYLPEALPTVLKTFERYPWADWATGNFLRYTDCDRTIIEAKWGPHILPKVFQNRHFPLMVFGPTAFWRRDVYNVVGGLDEQLHYGMDTDYWWRLTINGYKQVRVRHCCWAFRMHESSKTAEFGLHRSSEKVQKQKKAEKEYIVTKNRINIKWYGRVLIWLLRVLDGSFFWGLIRRTVLVGKRLDVVKSWSVEL